MDINSSLALGRLQRRQHALTHMALIWSQRICYVAYTAPHLTVGLLEKTTPLHEYTSKSFVLSHIQLVRANKELCNSGGAVYGQNIDVWRMDASTSIACVEDTIRYIAPGTSVSAESFGHRRDDSPPLQTTFWSRVFTPHQFVSQVTVQPTSLR